MADANQLSLLKKGVNLWNIWRKAHPTKKVDLSEANLCMENLQDADLSNVNLSKADLSNANLFKADLSAANLFGATIWNTIVTQANFNKADLRYVNFRKSSILLSDLKEANLQFANLDGVDFSGSNLQGANLCNANLMEANLSRTKLSGANLRGAYLMGVRCYQTDLSYTDLTGGDLQNFSFIRTNLEQAILTNCRVFGISAWDLQGVPKDQSHLIITHNMEAAITVDDLQVAQFIYLLLNNQNVRNVVDSITSKAVLILGRFSEERKPILEALRKELRNRNYLPILFDFGKPANRDITETVSTLAHLARFIIADITDAKSIPQELQAIVPFLPSVPVQPILHVLQKEYGMFEHFKRYPWVLQTYYYNDIEKVASSISDEIIIPLEAKFNELKKI